MRIEEGEDFQIIRHDIDFGRFIVVSKEPYYVDLDEELGDRDPYTDLDDVIRDLLSAGRIEPYIPNYTVEISMFDGIEMKDNRTYENF